MNIIPNEIKLIILKYVGIKSFCNISLVNKEWCKLIKDENLWKYLTIERCGHIKQIDGSWYMTYRLYDYNKGYILTHIGCDNDSTLLGIYKTRDIAIKKIYLELATRFDYYFCLQIVDSFREYCINKYQEIPIIDIDNFIYNIDRFTDTNEKNRIYTSPIGKIYLFYLKNYVHEKLKNSNTLIMTDEKFNIEDDVIEHELNIPSKKYPYILDYID